MLLSASLIVRDEAEALRKCLASIRELVDEIVVVDTGSTDDSREAALSFGARVEDFPWNGNFSDARNRGLDLVRSEWVLYIDADEQALPGDTVAIREQLRDPAFAGYEVLLRPRPNFTPYWALRLFRSDPAIRFRGVIHENPWPALKEYCRGERRVGRSSLFLDHIGYEGDQAHKYRRNLPMLREALEADPTSIYCWCHLADIHSALGEEDLAIQALEKALAIVRSRPVGSVDDSLPYVRLVHRGVDAGRDVSELLAEGRKSFPWNMHLIWLEGRSHIKAGRYELAIPLFERLTQSGHEDSFEKASAYDSRIFGVLAYESIAMCYFRLQRYEESRKYYELAAKAEPASLEYRAKLELCTALARGRGGNG